MPRPTASNGPSEPSARRRGRLSAMSDAPPPSGPRSMARTVALGAIAFCATLILLFGFSNLVSRSAGGPVATPRATGTGPAPSGSSQALATSTAAPASIRVGRPGPRRCRRHRRLRSRLGRGDGEAPRHDRGDRLHRRRQRLPEWQRRQLPRLLRADLGPAPGPDAARRPGTMTGRRRTSRATSTISESGPPRTARVGTRTTSARGT